jgi:hypothetical protein
MILGKKRNLSHIILVEIVVSFMFLTELLMENTHYFEFTLPMKGLLLLGLLSIAMSFGAFAQDGEGNTPCACPPAADRPVVIVTDNGGLGTGTVTWGCDTIYVLQEQVFVNSGDTLTIEPGAIVKGGPGTGFQETSFSVGNITEQTITYATYPGSLIISMGAVLLADGTPDCAITFTHEADPLDGTVGVDVKGQWGGLIICGAGQTNTMYYDNPTAFPSEVLGPGTGTDLAEGIVDLTGNDRHVYGGNTGPAESSGILRYVSFRHGSTSLGYSQNIATNESNNGNETNLLQLCAVGSGTQIDHIELVSSADDGLQVMGGTVDLKYVAAGFNAEDGVEFDHGWAGRVQYLFVINDSSQVVGDSLGISNALDIEGDDWEQSNVDITFMPYTNPVIINGTFIGPKSQSGLRIHNGGSPRMSNSIFSGFGQGIDFEDHDPCDAWEMLLFSELVLKNNQFWDVGDSTSIMDMILYDGHIGSAQFLVVDSFLQWGNEAQNPMFDYSVAIDEVTGMVSDPVFLEPGNGLAPALDYISPDAWFDQAMYFGAFEPGGNNWLTCWSYLEQVGLFTVGDSVGEVSVPGCIYLSACNFNVEATIDDGSCEFDLCFGCIDVNACNFDAVAYIDDLSCMYAVAGYDCAGLCLSDTDADGVCDAFEVSGCQDASACDYDCAATESGLCDYSCLGCTYDNATNYDAAVNTDDGSCTFDTAVICPADVNGDGYVTAVDLLDLLSAYGDACSP